MLSPFGKWAANEGLVVLVAGLFAVVELALVGGFVTQDTWLALLSGREIADNGLPVQDTLTAWTIGADWIDQQWLGQLSLYGVHSLGSLELVALLHVLLVTSAFTAMLVAARKAGATARSTAYIGALAVIPCLIVAANIRTQSFAFPLFAAVMWLLVDDSRKPSSRVYWTIPMLALWANVHGSVTLGAGFTGLAGLLSILTVARDPAARAAAIRHALPLLVLAPLTVFASPYATDLPSYYQDTLLNSEFSEVVSEWMGPELSIAWAPFYALAGFALVVVGQARAQMTAFELAALIATLILGLLAIRNLAWFGLTAILVLPAALSRARSSRHVAGPVGVASLLTASVGLGLVAALTSGLAAVDTKVDKAYPPRALSAIADAAGRDRSIRIFADSRYADWILWHHQELRGRVLFDIRFEMLEPRELRRIVRFNVQAGADWLAAADGARLAVLDPDNEPLGHLPTTATVLLRDPQARRLYRSDTIDVVLRRPGVG